MSLLDRYVDPHKRYSDRQHARRRAAERYGLDLTHADLDAIATDVIGRRPNVVFLRADPLVKGRTWVAVRCDARWALLVFDQVTSTVVTFLPEYELSPYWELLARREGRLGGGPRVDVEEGSVALPTPPVGTILGRVKVTPLPPPPAYTPPAVVPTTFAEAVARLAALDALIASLRDGVRSCWERRAMGLYAQYKAVKTLAKAERRRWQLAVMRTRAAALRAGHAGPLDQLRLLDDWR